MDDLSVCYGILWSWLSPGGYMSHQIDLSAHGTSSHWNGFRTYNELTWALIRGGRPFQINREPASAHISAVEKTGFTIKRTDFRRVLNELNSERLAPHWKNLDERDLTTSGLFLQTRKP